MDNRRLRRDRGPRAALVATAGLVAVLAGCGSAATATVAGTPAGTVTGTPAGTVTGTPPATVAAPSATQEPASRTAGASLPISVQSGAAMRAAGNAGPSSSILLPSTCHWSGAKVTAAGAYRDSFVPAVYARYGDMIDLYVFGPPTSGYPSGIQLGELSLARPPAVGGEAAWTVTVPLDTSLGSPRRCLVAAQPTHDFEGAPSAY